MIDVKRETALYLSSFDRVEATLPASGSSWLHGIRRAALARFAELGFPSPKQEEWRLTNVAPIAAVPFEPAGAHELGQPAAAGLERAVLGAWPEHRLVFVNGRSSDRLSSRGRLPSGVAVESLAAVLREEPARVEPYLARYAEYRVHPFRALNTAFIADGAFVHLPAGVVLEAPIHLVFVSTAPGAPWVSHPRNLIVAGPGSQATIVESYVGPEGEVYFTNAVTEAVVGENAVLEHYKVQRESERAFHVATLQVHQERSSSVVSHSISLGGALTRNDVNVVLGAEGAGCTLYGLYLAAGQQLVDNHTTIDHAKPHCTSVEFYKGVLGGRARGVFNGRIVVRPDAQKTDAKQTNKNLLLSDDATVDSKPELEIFANDVKCTHGSALGQLEDDALFYLRARGIDEAGARSLLIHGFAADVVERITVKPIRDALDQLLLARLPAGQLATGGV